MRRASLLIVLGTLGALASAAGPARPWESPFELPRIPADEQTLLRSSRCPSGCRYDRTSAGDTRYLREENGEQVIFEERGPGVIARIWMTAGNGYSQPLDSDVRIRIRLDGEEVPRVDAALPEFFGGAAKPFAPPLAFDRLTSGGGNVAIVPIPYRTGCRVSLVNAAEKRIWFQFTFQRFPEGTPVETYRTDADLSAFRSFLGEEDPWAREGGDRLDGALDLGPGAGGTALSVEGPGALTELSVLAARDRWEALRLRLVFDGVETADVSLAGFFAAGRPGGAPARSLLLREHGGWLSCYFPMPFFRSVEVRVVNSGPAPASIHVSARRLAVAPPPESGLFGAREVRLGETRPPEDTILVAAQGRGKWVGLFLETGSVAGQPEYVEGDERVYVDGSPHPTWYGTGVEDLFGGGFSFDRGPFGLPLWGNTYKFLDKLRDSVMAAYRFLVTDAVPFSRSLEIRLENGPTGLLPMRVWSVVYLYQAADPGLVPLLAIDVADTASASAVGYSVNGDVTCAPVDSAFEREPAEPLRQGVCGRLSGRSRFRVAMRGLPLRLRLRRRFDVERAGQAADVFVDGRLAGRFPPADANPFRRFREQEIALRLPPGDGTRVVEIEPVPMSGEPFTEIRWELFAGPPLPEAGPFPVLSGAR